MIGNFNDRQHRLHDLLKKELLVFFEHGPLAIRLEIAEMGKKYPTTSHLKQAVKEELIQNKVEANRIVTSTAHTTWGEEGLILVIGSNKPLGVDVENVKRMVNKAVEPRIANESERKLGLTILQMWVIKEALFKANPNNSETYLPQYKIVEWQEDKQIGKAVWGLNLEFTFKLLNLDSWHIAIAY